MSKVCLHDAEEIARRYSRWARMSRAESGINQERERAWNLYVDARDGLEDGTTQAREDRKTEEHQLPLFSRRLV